PSRLPLLSWRGASAIKARAALQLPYRPMSRPYRSVDRQHDLADMVARFHQPMRLGRLGQREGRMDRRLQPAFADERPDLLGDLVGEHGFETDFPRPQRRAG